MTLLSLLDDQGSPVDLLNDCSDTQQIQCKAIRVLLNHSANVDFQDCEGDSCVHLAANNGPQAALEVLMEEKANLDCVNVTGATPLSVAIASQSRNANRSRPSRAQSAPWMCRARMGRQR